MLRHRSSHFCSKAGSRHINQKPPFHLHRDPEAVQDLESFVLSHNQPVSDNPRVTSFNDEGLSVGHHLPDEEHDGGGPISNNVVLGGARSSYEGSGGVEDLLWKMRKTPIKIINKSIKSVIKLIYHLVKQHIPILRDLDVSSAGNQPKNDQLARVNESADVPHLT